MAGFMILREAPIVIEPRDSLLIGRDSAKRHREKLSKRIEQQSNAESIVQLDFQQVKLMDYSAADELVCKLLRRLTGGDIDGKFLVLLNINDQSKENIQAALELQQLACIHIAPNGERQLLGKISPELADTYELAVKLGRITARDLVREAGLKISAGGNRLTRLKQLGLLALEESEAVESGGRQNIYTPIR